MGKSPDPGMMPCDGKTDFKLTSLFPRLAHPSAPPRPSLVVLRARLISSSSTPLALSLGDAGTDSDRSTKDINAIKLAHSPLRLFRRVEIDEAVAWIATREGIRGNADSDDVESVVLEQILDIWALGGVEEIANVESCALSAVVA